MNTLDAFPARNQDLKINHISGFDFRCRSNPIRFNTKFPIKEGNIFCYDNKIFNIVNYELEEIKRVKRKKFIFFYKKVSVVTYLLNISIDCNFWKGKKEYYGLILGFDPNFPKDARVWFGSAYRHLGEYEDDWQKW